MPLVDYLARHPPQMRGARKWLYDRPDVLAEVLAAFERSVPTVAIHGYLREEHGLTIGYARFHVLLTEIARSNR